MSVCCVTDERGEREREREPHTHTHTAEMNAYFNDSTKRRLTMAWSTCAIPEVRRGTVIFAPLA